MTSATLFDPTAFDNTPDLPAVADTRLVVVTGSRSWRQPGMILQELEYWAGSPVHLTVAHGAASGADSMAHWAATLIGAETHPIWPDYTIPYPRCYHERNQKLINLGPDLVLAFPSGRAYGTTDAIDRAVFDGIPVRIVKEVK